MSYTYPYGTVPGQAPYRAQVNPHGYASPVVQSNPFAALVMHHGLKKAFGGSSYSADPDVAVVTYDSYMDDKDYSTKTLGISSIDLKTFGKPLGLKFKDCDVVIPLPSKKAVCNAVEKQVTDVAGSDISDKKKKEIMQMISNNLAIEFFKNQCKHGDPLNPATCNSFSADSLDPTKIAGVDASIRRVTGP